MALPASSARVRAAYIAEVTPGTTPSTPAFQIMRVTGAGIRTNKKTAAIRELRTDANVMAEVQQSQHATAAYQFALSYGSFDDIIAAALRSTWSTNVVKNGTTLASFTFEEMGDNNGTNTYSRLTYGLIDTFSLDVPAEGNITGSFGVIGQKEALATSAIASATYTATNTKTPMASGLSAGSLSVASLSTPKVHRVTLDIKNGVRPRFVIDSLYPDSFGHDLMDVTGTIEVYFVDNTAYQKVLDHGGGSLAVTLGSVTGEKYTISLPTITFLDGARQVGGTSNDVMVSIPFRATGSDNSSNPSIQITRAVA